MICSGVFPWPKTTSGAPQRSLRCRSTWANPPVSSRGAMRRRLTASAVGTLPSRTESSSRVSASASIRAPRPSASLAIGFVSSRPFGRRTYPLDPLVTRGEGRGQWPLRPRWIRGDAGRSRFEEGRRPMSRPEIVSRCGTPKGLATPLGSSCARFFGPLVARSRRNWLRFARATGGSDLANWLRSARAIGFVPRGKLASFRASSSD